MNNLKDESEYLNELEAIHDHHYTDLELSHFYSDALLVKVLRDMGWDKLADEYESTYKWYA